MLCYIMLRSSSTENKHRHKPNNFFCHYNVTKTQIDAYTVDKYQYTYC